MSDYPFALVQHGSPVLDARQPLAQRPFIGWKTRFADEAQYFCPGPALETAINTAIAVGEPLLITGATGTGKTQAAYYVAYKLSLAPVLHFQVKSDTTARDLLYHFDAVRYFYDANVRGAGTPPAKRDYIEPGLLWRALEAEQPRVLLIDEIDKAPRDFPNDLLHELDQMEFTVRETGDTVAGQDRTRPLVFITSNSERRLPEPFLRRCIYHNIEFTEDILRQAVEARAAEFQRLGDKFLALALRRFIELYARSDLRKKPATGELLVWLRILALAAPAEWEKLEATDLSQLPYLGALIKDAQDQKSLNGGR